MWVYFFGSGTGQWDRLSKEWPPREARQDQGLKRGCPYSRIFSSRAIWQRAQGRQKVRAAQSCPTEPWRVGKRDRERSGALLWGARWRAQSQSLQFPVSIHVVRDWRVPGCGSAPACRCAENAVLRAGRAHSSTLQSRRRCGRRGTAERKCHTDLDRAERSGPGARCACPRGGHARWHGGDEGPGRQL